MTLIEGILTGVAILFSFVAALFAWLNHRRRPKLELHMGDAGNQIAYEKDGSLAYVHATLANVGKTAAHNVQGRVEFESGRVLPTRRYHMGKLSDDTVGRATIDPDIAASSDNWATLRLGTLVPRPYTTEDTLHARSFLESPRHFLIPVKVAAEGQTRVTYWFVCDEGEKVENTAILDFPKQTS